MRKSYSRFKNIRIIPEITASQLGFAIFFSFSFLLPPPPHRKHESLNSTRIWTGGWLNAQNFFLRFHRSVHGLQKDLFTDLNLASFRMHTLLLRVFPSLNINYLQLLNAASI